jgi:2-oxoisovalerate dehydrogenase E1 component
MASENRPDRPEPARPGRRYTTRAFLLPDDDPAEAGDGAAPDDLPEETFGAGPETDDADALAAPLALEDAGGPEKAADDAEGETPEAGPTAGLGATISAAGAGVVGALADALAGDEDGAPAGPAGGGAAGPEAGPADAGEAEAPGPPETVPADTAETTADVDAAFDAQSDVGKPAPRAASGAGQAVEGTLDVTPLGPDDFEPDDLKHVLRLMMTSRRLDEKMLTLLKQGKGFFHIGSSGHEASQVALGREFRGGHDWFCFYYRDLGTALAVGVTPAEVLRAHFGKAADPFGGGRQMPEHFGHRDLNILSTSSSVGAQYLPAVGFALAAKREDGEAETPRAVYASGGEGSTSQGAFHEALNWTAREALPVVFHVQDNKYAISVPVEEQTAGGSIWPLFAGYTGLARVRYDGTDFFQSAAVARAALAHVRAGKGPVALHADVVRLLPHSSSDDHRKYREDTSLDADRARDPVPAFAARLVEANVMTDAEVDAMRAEIHAEIDRTARQVEAEADPDPETATAHVTYEGEDTRQYEAEGEAGDLVVMVDAINHALDEEMARDERVLVYGEDVGGGKGGVFTATRGLTTKHGRDRCFNSPLAEHSIIGSAVGLACAGYKPVVEIQFGDYIWPGMQPLRNQVASMRYRSNGAWACPMVIRVPVGGYIHGGLCHSQNVEALFGHFPGLQVVLPSNAADAKGLLKTAIRGEDPVLFLEHKALYRQGPARSPEPHADWLVPFGKARVAREGTDLTVVTWGAIVYKALNVAKALEKEGVSVEVIDVRSILPFDTETVLASARKTGRVLVAYEDHEFMGFGAEVAAQVADAAFGHLDAPVKRVAGAFSSIPYADPLEKAVLPQDDDVLDAARAVLAY